MLLTEYTAEWYDKAYLEYPPYEDTPMRHMYEMVAKLIPRLSPVIDLGCGSGYLASALINQGYISDYLGLDFSATAIELAKNNLRSEQLQFEQFAEYTKPAFAFEVADLREWKPDISGKTHQTIFTCFEVLEHIEDDESIVDLVPARSKFIFSVPNYWSRSHVRTFDSMGVAVYRYSKYLDYTSVRVLPTKQEGAAIYLYEARRRKDKW